MLGGRTVTLKLEKPGVEEGTEVHVEQISLEDRAELYLSIVERISVKLFTGLCVYVVLDTRRKVAIAKASRPR
jgi:hypothetical protein